MSEVLPLTMIGIIILIAIGLSIIVKKLGQNPVLGFIIAGFLLGPFGIGFLNPTDQLVTAFSELGLFVLLFYLGLELSLKDFLKAGSSGFGLALIDMICSAGFGFILMYFFGFSLLFSILAGFMLFSTSTAVVAKFVLDKGMIKNSAAQLALSILILQDFLGILLVVFITSASQSSSALGLSLNALVFAVATFVAVYEMSSLVEQWLRKNEFGHVEMTLFALGTGLIVATIASMLDLSIALGAYFTGFALAETRTGQKIKSDIGFMRDFFLVFFFVGFGTTLFFNSEVAVQVLPPIASIMFYIFLGLMLAAAAIIAHLFVLGIFGGYFGLNEEDSSLATVLLVPLGEFVVIISISAMTVLKEPERTMIAPIAFILILITVILFQPLFNMRGFLQKIISKMPKPFKRKEPSEIKPHDSASMKNLKNFALNTFIIFCLAWITAVLYYELPVFGVPIVHGRDIVAILTFLFFASVPAFKSFKALKNILASARHKPKTEIV